MSGRPTLALCIPAFNAARHLPALFSDVRAQSVPFDEVLLYDDASTDGTGDLARSLGARVIRGEENRGCSHGKNALARAAGSAWLHFCDADDRRSPVFAETAAAWTGSDGHDVVLMSHEDRAPDGTVLATRVFRDGALRDDLLRTLILEQHGNCGIYRRAAFLEAGGFDADPAVLYNEDDALHLRLALAGLRFRAEERVVASILQAEGSMSRTRPVECLRAKFHVLEKAAPRIPGEARDALGIRLWRCAAGLGSHGDWGYADRCLRLAADLGQRGAPEGRTWFRLLARLHPGLALRTRERAVRTFRPGLRRRTAAPAAAP